MKRSHTFRYTLAGAAFGFVFPIIATVIDAALHRLPPTPASYLQVQAGSPLHWIIDTAPLFLGLFASFAGRRQDNLEKLNHQLAEQVAQRDATVSELEVLRGELETRVAERTHELEQQAGQLGAAAAVGKAVTAIHDLERLLPEIARLINRHFGFYHVGIFMLDEAREYAVLKATNSEPGQAMLAAGHKLRVGREGIVGHVTGQGQARIAGDVGADTAFYDNPYLPDTRAELTLPLIAGGLVLGALDIQSDQAEAFKEQDIEILQVLADQVAIAVQNAALFTENQEALSMARKAYQQLSREALDELVKASAEIGFSVNEEGQVRPARAGDRFGNLSQIREATPATIDSATLAVPVKIRDQVVGAFKLRKPPGNPGWSAEEIGLIEALTGQLGVALENARLHTDALVRAERERQVTEITTKLRASNDPQHILQTAVMELRQALKAQDAQVRFQTLPDGSPFEEAYPSSPDPRQV